MHKEIATPEPDAPEVFLNERQRVSLLARIYLEAGLPLEFATRSAIADFELFEEEALNV